MPRPISVDGDWLNGAESRRIANCAASALQRAAMLGTIRVKLDPGWARRYNRAFESHHHLGGGVAGCQPPVKPVIDLSVKVSCETPTQ